MRQENDGGVRGHLAQVRPVVPAERGPDAQAPVVGPVVGEGVAGVGAERVAADGEDVEVDAVATEPRDLGGRSRNNGIGHHIKRDGMGFI